MTAKLSQETLRTHFDMFYSAEGPRCELIAL